MAIGPAVSLRLRRMRHPGGGLPVFGQLDLEVGPGEVVAIVGPSGIGKTTLLRIVAGLEQGFEGQVLIDGRPSAASPPPGFVFQDARLLPWLDAAANIRAVTPGISDMQIEEVLDRVGLSGHARAFPYMLSGGMQRRLGLARALAARPDLLLLDEPFVSIDAAAVLELQALFREVFSALRPTVLLVSHDPQDAARLSNRVLVLSGRPATIAAELRLPSDASDGAEGERRAVARIKAALDG